MSRPWLLAAAAVAATAAIALLQRRTRRVPRPSSSYLERASQDASIIANRTLMIAHYLEDVASPRPPAPPPGKTRALRFVTWNLNILCGPDWKTPISAEQVADLLASFDADVLVLQELPNDVLDTLWSSTLSEPLRRVRELDRRLRAIGYKLLRSDVENATLLAVSSRLHVCATESVALDTEPVASVNGEEVWTESRGARYATLQLQEDSEPFVIDIYATHLSHKDSTLVPLASAAAEVGSAAAASEGDGASLPPMRQPKSRWKSAHAVGGVRLRETEALLRHWRGQPRGPTTNRLALILADFNSPVREHYTAAEWRVIVAGLTAPGVAQPVDDGVAACLRTAGFRCAYELCEDNNFGGRPAPPMTHCASKDRTTRAVVWCRHLQRPVVSPACSTGTGTTVDFAYVHGGDGWRVRGTHVVHTPLSDHLPVIFDLELVGPEDNK